MAQSKRELTPDIVKAALYSPASAKIPAPKINVVVGSGPHPNSKPGSPVAPVTGAAPLATPNGGIAGPQGFPSKQNQLISTPRPPTPNATLQSQSGVSSPGMPAGSSMPAFRSPNSSNWLGGGTVGPQPGVVPQFPNKGVNLNSQDGFGIAASGLTASSQSKPQEATSLVQRSSPHSNHSASLGHQPPAKDSRATQVTGNGFASNSHFGDVFSATSILPKQDSKPLTSSAGSLPASSALVPVSAGSQPNIKPSSINPLEITNPQQSVSHQYQQTQQTMKPNQRVPLQSSTIVHGGAGNSVPVQSQSQSPWPKMTQADFQKYNKVFVAVDTDKDGKITGEQARNLFLSWRLPRGGLYLFSLFLSLEFCSSFYFIV